VIRLFWLLLLAGAIGNIRSLPLAAALNLFP
jgi:hypothetical protein